MAVTRLDRKSQRNVARAKQRLVTIKHLTTKPDIKNIDVEAIKKEFAAKKQA